MHWRDQSDWKKNFTHNNPGNVYIEVENYYVKALTGWKGNTSITVNDLIKAKRILRDFDIVLISELMNHGIQNNFIKSFFDINFEIPKFLQGNTHTMESMKLSLASDMTEVREILMELNKYDLQLFEYAKMLVKQRLPVLSEVVQVSKEVNIPDNFQSIYLHDFVRKTQRNNNNNKFSVIAKFRSYLTDIVSVQKKEKILSLLQYFGPKDNENVNPYNKYCSPKFTLDMQLTLGIVKPLGHKLPLNKSAESEHFLHMFGNTTRRNRYRNEALSSLFVTN